MTTQAAFSPEEWHVVLEGPPTAGLIVITAAHGGTFRETVAMSKAYAEARAEHGIGALKAPWLALARSDAERALFARIRSALDPAATLNPNVLPRLPAVGAAVRTGVDHAT